MNTEYRAQIKETKGEKAMFNHKDIRQTYALRLAEHRKAQESLRQKIQATSKRLDKLNAKYNKMPYPHWLDHYLMPIAEALTHEFPNSRYELAGPFGLDCETSISLYQDKELLSFLQFVPGNLDEGEILLRDYTVDTHKFSPGTLGELNGMNHPDIPIPIDADVNWFLQQIKYFKEAK